MMFFLSYPNFVLIVEVFFVSVFRVCSGPCDRCAVTEKQIKTTNTEFKDTNQKNLSVISELGEFFCFLLYYYCVSSYCDSSVMLCPSVY